VIFDLTHPTSSPLSVEPGLGRVMVVARVQTVVPLCRTSVPAGLVKAACQSLPFDVFRSLSKGVSDQDGGKSSNVLLPFRIPVSTFKMSSPFSSFRLKFP
jgi:hypothetical protein